MVIPDLAGHGASAPLTGNITFAIQLSALEAILHAECPEPAILVGHSLGGWLACLLTLNHPELVRRVVLVNGPAAAAVARRTFPHPQQSCRCGAAIRRDQLFNQPASRRCDA